MQKSKMPLVPSQPFSKLQKILDKQQARPIRTSPAREVTEKKDTGLILNRKKVENNEAPIKRMFTEKLQSQGRVCSPGYTWEDMIKRTSNEVIIAQKVNISEARAFFPDTKRCLNPELNSEAKTQQSKKLVHSETHKEKQYNPSLITGEGMHAVDLRGERKRTEKVDLINKYQNSQSNWNKQTNHFVNKLKEEACYDPQTDFQPEEHYIDPKLQKKMDLMKKKCEVFKEVVKNNPIYGNRTETPKPNGRKTSVLGEYNNKSDIYMVGDSEAQMKKESAAVHSRKNFEQPKTDKVIQPDFPSSRRKHRDEYIQQNRILSKSVSNLNLEFREFRNGETDRKFGAKPGSISPSAQRNRGNL